MTTLHSDLSADLGCWRNASIHAHPSMSVCIGEIRDIQLLCWCPGVFFLFFSFFVLSARGRTAAKPRPLPPAEQGAECAHQLVWKSAFSRILPEGVTWRNLLQAPAACWMLCRQPTDTVCWCPGVVVFHLNFSLPVVYKQPQHICPIWNVLQCDFYMLAEMSGVDVNWGEAPHSLDTSLDSWSVRMYVVLSSCWGCSQILFLGILSSHLFDHYEVATWGGCNLLDSCQMCFCSLPALLELWII